jgi:hypothetical protein
MYEICNYGNSRALPYKGMNIFLGKNQSIKTEDKDMVDILSSYPYLEVREIKENIDYKDMNFWKLKKIAKEQGLELTRNVKKFELIKLLKKGSEIN